MKKIEDFLKADEQILWKDVQEKPGSRKIFYRRLSGYVLRSISSIVVLFSTCAAFYYAIEYASDLKGLFYFLSFAGMVFFIERIIKVVQPIQYYRSANLAYAISEKRLVVTDLNADWVTSILPGSIASLSRYENALTIISKCKQGEQVLYDLEDPEKAEELILKVLGSPHDPH